MSNGSFVLLDEGTCQGTHVQPFSTDIHLLFLECKQSWWLAAIVVFTILIKLGQNWMYTTIGQLQRELLQIPREERTCCTEKVLLLLWWEFVTGLVGIISILIITGNNAIIWVTIIAANMVGTALAFTNVEADHHSTALELINMLDKYPVKGKKPSCDEKEARLTYDAVTKLRQVLELNSRDCSMKIHVIPYRDSPDYHKNLVL